MKKLTTNKVNLIFITILLIFFILMGLPVALDQQVPAMVEEQIYKIAGQDQELSNIVELILRDQKVTWREYFKFIWR